MKLCVVILSGAADLPVESLGDRTPLAAARLPHLAELAARGRVGGVRTIPKGHAPAHETALSTLLGLDPGRYPVTAGALLALARGPALEPRETAFRCDLVNLYGGAVVDPTAGRMAAKEAEILVKLLDDALGTGTVRFRPGRRWRALLTVGEGAAAGVRTESPASFLGEPVVTHRASGPGSELIRSLTERAAEILPDHEINQVRIDLGENPASGIWIWGGGRPPDREVPEVAAPAVAVGGHPSFLGLARVRGFAIRRPAGSGGEDPAAVRDAALAALGEADLAAVHLEGALVHSRLGEVDGKVRFLEAVDEALIGPLAERLVESGEGRILVAATHRASVERRKDEDGVVPFLLAGAEIPRAGDIPFTEEGAETADLVVEDGPDLLEYARKVGN